MRRIASILISLLLYGGITNAQSFDDCFTPQIINQSRVSICVGEVVRLRASKSVNVNYIWTKNREVIKSSREPFLDVDEEGLYTVTAVNRTSRCETSANESVSVRFRNKKKPDIQIKASNQAILQGEVVQLQASGAVMYSWDAQEGLDNLFGHTTMASPLSTTTYSVVGTDKYGCSSAAAITIEVNFGSSLLAQKSFSPNGDGVEDHWKITGIQNFPECEVKVFDDGGTTVFEAQPYKNNWDANLEGRPLPEGSYYFIIKCNSAIAQSGTLQLTR